MLEESQLKYWRDQQWSRVSVGKDGKKTYKPCGKDDAQDNPERCKPKKKWQSMSSKEIKSDKTKKKQGGKGGKQFVSATKKGKVSGDYLKEQHDYRGSHKAPRMGDDAPLWDLTMNGVYPNDIYTQNAIRYYGDGAPYDREMFYLIMRYRNKPNEKIKIYRGIPKFMTEERKLVKELTTLLKDYKELGLLQYHDAIPEFKLWDDLRGGALSHNEYNEKLKGVKEVIVKAIQDRLKEVKKNIQKFKINHGDWVTPSRQYAKDHASTFDDGYEILTAEVYARDIFTDGSSWVEWGYDPQPPVQMQQNVSEGKLLNEKAGVSEWMETKANEIMDMYEKHKRDKYTTEDFFEYADLKFDFDLEGVDKQKEFQVDIEVISNNLEKVKYDGSFKEPNKIIINIGIPYGQVINKIKQLKSSSLTTEERYAELQEFLKGFHEKRKKAIKSILIHELNHMYSFHKGYKNMLDKNYVMSGYFKRGGGYLSKNSQVMKMIGNLMYVTHPAERTAQIISTVTDPETHQYPVKWIKKAIEFDADEIYKEFKEELEEIGIEERDVLKDIYFFLRDIGYRDNLVLKLVQSQSISLYELFKRFEKDFNRRGREMYKKLKKYEYFSKQ